MSLCNHAVCPSRIGERRARIRRAAFELVAFLFVCGLALAVAIFFVTRLGAVGVEH